MKIAHTFEQQAVHNSPNDEYQKEHQVTPKCDQCKHEVCLEENACLGTNFIETLDKKVTAITIENNMQKFTGNFKINSISQIKQ